MPGKAPVDKVGGSQENGPWPAEVEEIIEDKAYRRPVTVSDGSIREVEVLVTNIREVPDGGRAVAYQFDDPTAGGGE